MPDVLTLAAETRERVGKGASRAVRREGRVPAVIYGDDKPPLSISVEEKELVKHIQTGLFLNSTIEVVTGKKRHHTLPRDVQYHPVTDRPIHVDFLRVSAKTRVTVGVPVRFINEELSPGLKRGGVLNVVRYEVEVSCPASAIPDEFLVDVGALDVGESIHFSSIKVPDGVTPVIDDRDFTIATIAAPSALKSEEQEAEAAAEAETAEAADAAPAGDTEEEK